MRCCLKIRSEYFFSIRFYGGVIILLSLSGLTGCASVEPWEKGMLAKPEMGWTPDPIEAAMESHIFFSKEGSSGGNVSGGGGCGCN
ncbi:MAG: DUF4266 domain-containing protein [Gammaproteobacteria bacterium]|jgi:hypothetical protein|nr:DUF4266 domain-containing protein [Gammaproteobacteria bacterium]